MANFNTHVAVCATRFISGHVVGVTLSDDVSRTMDPPGYMLAPNQFAGIKGIHKGVSSGQHG
jgi:hypothetical protein